MDEQVKIVILKSFAKAAKDLADDWKNSLIRYEVQELDILSETQLEDANDQLNLFMTIVDEWEHNIK